ncbi:MULTISPECIES: AMP-binding protein [unclassified Pseudofrankia]|uniref:AMP-binding protein n=1 Tax=unclassified Pseudofrankia TaxID=2994372 RepID=UPI0008D94726|nr:MULTISPECIES: AMP-binding protein [unclassified Pseudofrankia]MDT3438109.1 AMP-binding protein [Pseudofrankia sp. BMG5.37]OHV56818.1 AMP-dependent synthetase [Pseudofrankia sp. BMG5.36]
MINELLASTPDRGTLHISRLAGTREVPLAEVWRLSGLVAAGLRARGLGAGDRIGILGANSLEWVVLDLAALRSKVETAGLEPGKFMPTRELMRRYGLSLLFTDRPCDEPGVEQLGTLLDDLTDLTGAAQPAPATYAPDEVTTIKFTSGSTGTPKGLGATIGSVDSSLNAVQDMFGHGPGDNLLVFLPLSLLQQRYWVYSALRYGHDVTVCTYEAAFAALTQVRPTVVMGVPGFFEGARSQIERRARRTGLDLAEVARDLFGDRIRYLWTGSAPADPATLAFFNRLGLPIYEGYGLNETCIVAKNHPAAHREGSVGRVLPGKQVIVDDDGVIHVRAEHPVNRRYAYCEPGDSERVFGPDGTVRTGDLGYLDPDGFLFILGRADDTIVLDNGKKVIVRQIEEHLKASPAIAECVLYCPAQTELVAVVSPASAPADTAAISAQLTATNRALSGDQYIHRVVVADEPFSIDNGLLTSQYKPRRKQIRARYLREIGDPRKGIHAA